MIVCIAEKPSVGRDIAKVLGATSARDGYMEGNGYCVTWTFGHLCALLDPNEYQEQWKNWTLSSLPMIPPRFGIKVTDDAGVQKQFNIIKSLIEKADEVINCGDAGQEGELIQRWVQQKAGCKCPVKRLWISSLTTEAIQDGFRTLKPQSDYQKLYEAGLMRAIGDWLLGMNATRAYTLRYRKENRQVLSIGRVQTPTLALIVRRQQEIERFIPRTYWELKTIYRDTLFSAIVRKNDDELAEDLEKLKQKAEKSKNKTIPSIEDLQAKNLGIDAIQSKEAGDNLVNRLQTNLLTVTSVEKKKGTESAPRLFDLTSLQVECNKKYGFSADETLKLIQSLYEKKITTYPRVDTTFLSEDIYPKCAATLKGIEDCYKQQIAPLHGKTLPKSKKVFDNTKVTDHHAIIPTGQRPNNLTEQERKVFDMVALRFIAAFYPDCQISTTTVLAKVPLTATGNTEGNPTEVLFRATGKQVLNPGWRTVFARTEETDTEETKEETSVLPDFRKGESGAHAPRLVERQTTPPKYYTEATLLRAMETAGKLVEDDELRDAMKENGIGRPSTRAAIIEKLYQRRYITKERKNLKATPMAVELIRTIHTPLLKSAELTGLWEKKLRQIERGDFSAEQFLAELKQLTADVVFDVKNNKAGMLCPVCRKGLIIRGNAAYGCSRWREGCHYREPFSADNK
ncbi:MAG: DNA topoisomerase 3 [Paludibacter sp.]|nr:DNA topoisomerase 3 [Bacteroidales bacterium]MCM1069446.1 DNA topoisomerase 3 [Prevotella sp.]MCM1353820.1 DNA topoisomerase 3 [Bacteroides sp.]MCM1442779.1 DNA topoisomerase 3 [Muribaculum sp.]MCM1481856.1 DNA topoisomerase 3 [Paludibacter sp.]